jgi:hypothetical protein
MNPIKTPLPDRFNNYLVSWSFLTCVLLGFLVSYLLFFIYPIFWGSPDMRFFTYVPAYQFTGLDLRQTLGFSESWLILKQSPYMTGSGYPPLTVLLFTSLLLVEPQTAYKIITLLSLLCYLFITVLFPFWTSQEKSLPPLLLLFFLSGLFSYGFQFELERGQFNLIAMSLCWLSLWLYYKHPQYRYLAYLLFSLSVQLKIYPAIFIVMFITDWCDWKNNLKKILGIALFNVALLFVLGPQTLIEFLGVMRGKAVSREIWPGNHSIKASVEFMLTSVTGQEILQRFNLLWLTTYIAVIQVILLFFVTASILLIIWHIYRHRQIGLNPYLFLACTLGALLLPVISHDYKLPLLAGPVALAFYQDPLPENASYPLRLIHLLLTFVFFIIYSSLLFSYAHKPTILDNNLPALLTLLIVTTMLTMITNQKHNKEYDSHPLHH